MTPFRIKGDWIELFKLLKLAGLAESGGQAKHLITNEAVRVNGVIEKRKAYKAKPGDKIQFKDSEILIEGPEQATA